MNSICLCSKCMVNGWTLSIWSRYFIQKYVCNHTNVDVYFVSLERKNEFRQPMNTSRMLPRLLPTRTANKPFFARMGHSFGFVSVLYTSFPFMYRCGPNLILNENYLNNFSPHSVLSWHIWISLTMTWESKFKT